MDLRSRGDHSGRYGHPMNVAAHDGRHLHDHDDADHRSQHWDHRAETGTDAVVFNEQDTRVFFGEKTGTFVMGEDSLGSSPVATTGKVVLADFNGDDALDITLSRQIYSTEVWLNQKDGSFSLASELSNSVALASADMNGDGKIDLLLGLPGESQIWLGDGTGHFANAAQQLAGIGNFGDVAIADLNGDCAPDAVMANEFGPSTVYINDGAGHFTDSGQRLAGSALSVALGDLTGDGSPDIFLGILGDDQVWLNDGEGNFADSGQRLPDAVRSWDVALGDLNSDGRLDAMVVSKDPTPLVYLNTGNGMLEPSQGLEVGSADMVGVALADIDRDGDLDAFLANFSGPNQVWLNDGDGVFSNSGQSIGDGRNLDVALGDLDGDVTKHCYVPPSDCW